MTQTMQRMELFIPLKRKEGADRIVEGVAFANEIVPGEGGIKLENSAMERATPDYLKFGAIREMHTSRAAGTAAPTDPDIAKQCGVTWEDGANGQRIARISAYISDDDAWKKVEDGTYKGFSVGVAPKVMRGKNVKECTWYETSLVDRPKDPDALFTMVRGEGADNTCEVEILEEDPIERAEEIERTKWTKTKREALDKKYFGDPENMEFPIQDQDDVDSAAKLIGKAKDPKAVKAKVIKIAKELKLSIPDAWKPKLSKRTEEILEITRGKFADYIKSSLPSRLRYIAIDMIDTVLCSINWDETASPEEKEAAARAAIDEFADFICPIISDKTWPNSDIFDEIGDVDDDERAASPTLTRFATIATERTGFLERIATLEATQTRLNTEVQILRCSVADGIQTISTLTTERDTATAELAEVQRAHVVATERVKALEDEPNRKPPVRVPEALERTLAAEGKDLSAQKRLGEIDEELGKISRLAPTASTTEGNDRISRIQSLKSERASLASA